MSKYATRQNVDWLNLEESFLAISKYLVSKSVNVRRVNVTPAVIKDHIDAGSPVLVHMAYSGEYYGRLRERSETRKGIADIKEWKDKLKDLEMKKFLRQEYGYDCGVVIGYNLDSGEFLLFTGSERYSI